MSTVKEAKGLWTAWQNCGCDDWDCRHYIECHDALDALTSGITPEQQAVLDAAVAWRNQWLEYEVRNFRTVDQPLAAAVDAMTRPPSVADRLQAWKLTQQQGPQASDDFDALVAEVRALEAGK